MNRNELAPAVFAVNQECPVVIGSEKQEREYFAGAGVVFDKNGMEVQFTDNCGDILLQRRLRSLYE